MLGCWDAGIQGSWDAGMLGCWDAGMLGCWDAGKLYFIVETGDCSNNSVFTEQKI